MRNIILKKRPAACLMYHSYIHKWEKEKQRRRYTTQNYTIPEVTGVKIKPFLKPLCQHFMAVYVLII